MWSFSHVCMNMSMSQCVELVSTFGVVARHVCMNRAFLHRPTCVRTSASSRGNRDGASTLSMTVYRQISWHMSSVSSTDCMHACLSLCNYIVEVLSNDLFRFIRCNHRYVLRMICFDLCVVQELTQISTIRQEGFITALEKALCKIAEMKIEWFKCHRVGGVRF